MRLPIILFLLFCISFGWSQSPEWLNCLSGEQVNASAETDASLWVATSGGLVERNKLTGTNRYYNCANSELQTNHLEQVIVDANQVVWIDNNGLTSIEDEVWTKYPDISGRMTLDEDGNILVANNGGIHKWNGSIFELIPFSDIPPYHIVSDVIVDKTNGAIWVSSYSFGLFRVDVYSNDQWESFDNNNSELPFESSVGNQFSFDANNILWMATYSGIYSYDGTWTNRNIDFGIQNEVMIDIVHDLEGNAYALPAYSGNKIIKVDENELVTSILFPDSFEGNVYPNFISVSENGKVGLGNSKYGLWEYKDSNWLKIKTTEILLANNTLEVYKDPAEIIYLSSGQPYSFNQLFSYQGEEWKNIASNSPFIQLPDNSSGYNLSFYGDIDSDYYMHFRNKLYVNDGVGEWLPVDFPELEENVDESNTGIFVDLFSNTWLLNKSSAYIFLERNGDWQTFLPSQHGATSGAYNAFFNHPVSTDLWISSNIGLSTFNYASDSWSRFSFKDYGLAQRDAILKLGNDGTIWGYNSTQFFRMTDLSDIEILYELKDTDNNNNRFSAILVEENEIWLGFQNGILLYEDGMFTTFDNTNSGMSTGMVNVIIRDDNNNLWISAYGGLTIYNPDGISEDLISKSGLSKTEQIEELGISIFPNPSTETITISTAATQTYMVTLHSMMGEELMSKREIRTPYQLDHALESGVYLLSLSNMQGEQLHLEKIIINR